MEAQTEDHLLRLLAETQSSSEGPRKNAEQQLSLAQRYPAFPVSLTRIATHSSVEVEIRQSALLILKRWVERFWNLHDQEDGDTLGPVILDEGSKELLRNNLLELATSENLDRKLTTSASYVVTRIANVDYPDQWPDLLSKLLLIIPNSSDERLHGALRVLFDLVEDALSEDEFFTVARDILTVLYDVATNETRKPVLRAFAISIFRETFNIMEMVKDEFGNQVKEFADRALTVWSPLLLHVIKTPLPPRMTESGKEYGSMGIDMPEFRRGLIALKLQVMKTLMKIRLVFPQLLLPQTLILFSATWAELNMLQEEYEEMYVKNEEQGRLEDADGLPYTLDFLVLEDLDFFQSCLKAPPVQKELRLQIQQQTGIMNTPWILDLMKLVVTYAQIIMEDESLWDIDVNLFLAEETGATTNYTARTACGDLLLKLAEWLHQGALEGLLAYTQHLLPSSTSTWRLREASLFLLTQLMNEYLDLGRNISPDVVGSYLEQIEFAINCSNEPLLRARGYLVAGVVVQNIPDMSHKLLDHTIKSINSDESEVVQVACIKSIQGWIKVRLQPEHQLLIINAISEYFHTKDLTELEDADDLLFTLVETLKTAINLDPQVTISNGSVLDLLFTAAKHGAANFQMTMLVTETFEAIVQNLSSANLYTPLCLKVLPSLTGALNVGEMTGNVSLVELATELLVVMTQNGSEPLPPGYIAASLPKLARILMATSEGGILRAGAEAVKFMLMHDHQQVFAWQDEQHKSGLEVCLIIIDKLLCPTTEDNAASEVGGLAAELVEKAGKERLGPYLEQLLRAVTSRLASAEAAPFIQSLILVFGRLSLASAHDVVEFLSQIDVNGTNGLQVVLSKWLENSVSFAGYDEIRQNVIALSKIYSLNDPRLAHLMVRGDQIIPASDVIVTRSRAKKLPTEYTIIPAPLKILKVLIEELISASGHMFAASVLAAGTEDDDEWEDVPGALDLASSSAKNDLMALSEANFTRQRDDETQAYLIEFFLRAARENIGGFSTWYPALTPEERGKLEEVGRMSET